MGSLLHLQLPAGQRTLSMRAFAAACTFAVRRRHCISCAKGGYKQRKLGEVCGIAQTKWLRAARQYPKISRLENQHNNPWRFSLTLAHLYACELELVP